MCSRGLCDRIPVLDQEYFNSSVLHLDSCQADTKPEPEVVGIRQPYPVSRITCPAPPEIKVR